MQGVLSLYDSDKKLAFFQSGPIQSTSCLVFIGGMGGGFLTLDYFEDLSNMLSEIGWSTVQVLLSSSYSGYSYGSLDADGQEIMSLVKHLVNKCGKTKIFLVGHSTGCQDVLWYFNHYYDPAHNVVAAILKSPVSDREAFADDLPNFKEILDWAMDKCEKGFPKAVYPKMIGGTPFTAYRLKSLLNRMDDDDFFSTDFTDEERAKKFGKIPVPTYVFFGERESNVKGGVAGMHDLGKSFAKVSPNIKFMPLVAQGDHCFSHPEAVKTFLKHIREIIEKDLS